MVSEASMSTKYMQLHVNVAQLTECVTGLHGIMISAAPGTAETPRAHITNMAALGTLNVGWIWLSRFGLVNSSVMTYKFQNASVTLDWIKTVSQQLLMEIICNIQFGVTPWLVRSMPERIHGAMTLVARSARLHPWPFNSGSPKTSNKL